MVVLGAAAAAAAPLFAFPCFKVEITKMNNTRLECGGYYQRLTFKQTNRRNWWKSGASV